MLTSNKKAEYFKFIYYTLYIVVACLLFLDRFDSLKTFDVDLMWHIRGGEEIVRTGTISLVNNFSWIEGTIWTQQEWLFDVLIYLITRYTGIIGFAFFGFVVVGLSYAVPYFTNNWKFKILSVVAYYHLYIIFNVNTINRSMWLGTLIVYTLMRLYDGVNDNVKRNLILVFLLGVLVSNFHSGLIVAVLPMFAVCIIADVYFLFRFDHPSRKKYISIHFGFIALFLVGYCFNPLGIYRFVEMFKVPFYTSTSNIPEWRTMNITGALSAFLLFAVVVTIGYGFSVALRKKDLTECRHILVSGSLVCLGIMSQKSGILPTFFFMAYAYKYFELLLSDIFVSGTKIEKLLTSLQCSSISKTKWVPFPLVVVVAFLIALPLSMRLESFDDYVKHEYARSYFADKTKDGKYCSNIVSQEILDYLRGVCDTDDFSILNSYIMGNYLIWERIPTFIDSRQYPYIAGATAGDCTALDDLNALTNSDVSEFQQFLDKYEFQYVVTGNNRVVYNETIARNIGLCDNYELIMYDEDAAWYLYRRIE